jgi:hypothetical protein
MASTQCSFLIVILPCHQLCWRICRTITHLLLVGSALGCIIFVMATHNNFFNPKCEDSIYELNAIHLFCLNIFCTVSHLLLGLLVLPSKEVGPKLFSPIVHVFFRCLRKLGSANCLMKWREDINEFLDDAEHGRVGGEEQLGYQNSRNSRNNENTNICQYGLKFIIFIIKIDEVFAWPCQRPPCFMPWRAY